MRRAMFASVFLIATSVIAAPRTFVASTGLDTNPCSRSAPCRSFSSALAVTDSDGEVIVLDSAGYGPVTIAQSAALIAPLGVYAGVTASTGDGIIVNIAPAARVVLKGLSINSGGA